MIRVRRKVVRKQRTDRKEPFSFLLLLSFLIHAVLILLLALLFAKKLTQKTPPAPEPPPPEVTLELPPPPKDRPFAEAKEITDKAPEKAPFESDQNSKAASENPASGALPLPSQQGVTQTALELQTQRHTEGEKPASASGNPAPAQPPSPPVQQRQATPVPTPIPTPISTPKPTPPQMEPHNSVRLLEIPKEEAPPSPQTQQTKTSQKTPPPAVHPPSSPGTPGAIKGYQPETRQTVIYGNISNRGHSAVATQATPLGRYKKSVSNAIGSRWYYYVNERMGLISIGTVSVSFQVTPSGSVVGLRVLSSNGNQSLTDCSLRSIMDAKLPPIPPEVVPTLQNGCIEIDYSFTLY